MGKIRINELARELEVKPNVILDLLPELGVADKKTHSSSLDDDVALELRRRLTGGNGAPHAARSEDAEAPLTREPEAEPAEPSEPARPQPAGRIEPLRAEPSPEPSKEAPVEPPPPSVRPIHPLRPPLASHSAPSMPLPHAVPHVTPAVPHATPAPPAHAAPAHPQPLPAQPPRAPAQPAALTQPSASPGSPLAQPSSPHPPAAHIARGSSIPARPVPPPAPKPGQIISGPRQPLPAGLGEIP